MIKSARSCKLPQKLNSNTVFEAAKMYAPIV